MPVKKNVIKKTALAPTVLIAGGAGFIGSNLAETLLLKDARVIVLDNFKTGKKSYVDHLLSNEKFALFDADIGQGLPEEIGSVDYIFHLAGLEPYTYGDSAVNLDTLLTNALGTKNLLDLANKSPAKFLLASSINVYQGIISPVNLDNYFGQSPEESKKYSLNEAKRFAEAVVWEFYKKNNTDVRVVRLPQVYGPKMDPQSCGNLGSLIKDLVEHNGLNVFGDGLDKEYYLYVTDVVSGLIKALFNKGTEAKIFTLTGKEPYTILEIAYILKSIADREVQIDFKSRPKSFEFFDFKSPDTQTLSILKWEQKIPLREGLMKTLQWQGYPVNEHPFKPMQLVAEKEKQQNEVATISVPSVAPVAPNEPVIAISNSPVSAIPATMAVAPAPVSDENTLTSLADIVPQEPVNFKDVEVKELQRLDRPKRRIELPKLHVPHLFSINKQIVFGVGAALFAFLVFFVTIPGILTYTNLKKSMATLESVPQLIGQLDSASTRSATSEAFQDLTSAQNYFSQLKWIFTVAGKHDDYVSYYKLMSSARYFTKSLYSLSKASNPFNALWDTIRPTSDATLSQDQFVQSRLDIEAAKNNLQLAQAEIKNISAESLPESIRAKYIEYNNILTTASTGLTLASSAAEAVPDLVGVAAPKKYLILFQNSNEIRATGGFIGSYALLELDKGKIANLQIDDIYNPDGQIELKNIKIAPPKQIKDFLKEDRLYIRNANWDPDFPKSAQTIQNLYQRVTGVRTDGVIAMDLYFVKNLLKVTGPVFLTAYNEEINADNLYERAQMHSEFNYKNGSDQKKSFLTVLGSKLMEKLFALPKDTLPELFVALTKSMEEKDLAIYLSNNPFATVLNEKGLDGSLHKTDGDYLYVVNSNLGGTKANYYVKNTLNYEVLSMTRDGLLRGRLTLNYNHTGEDSSWPGGPYTDYVRVLTQRGTKLTGAKVVAKDGTEKDIFKDVTIVEDSGYTTYETNFKLEPKDSISVVLEYDLPQQLAITNETSKQYNLYWQKQPGTSEDSALFNFNVPFGLNIANVNQSEAEVTDSDIKLKTILSKDLDINISLN